MSEVPLYPKFVSQVSLSPQTSRTRSIHTVDCDPFVKSQLASGAGVSRDAEALLTEGLAERVGVPLQDDCESLNVRTRNPFI